MNTLEPLIERALTGTGISAVEASILIETAEPDLFAGATRIREAHFGRRIELCAIINAKSGLCDMDCRFCSQSSHSTTEIETYPFLTTDELERRIREVVATGDCRCSVVTSGGKLSREELNRLTETVRRIGGGSLPMCGSLGRLTQDELESLRDAGITRFHHNLEASQAYYPAVCSTQRWEERLDTVRAALAAGMQVCSGGLFGMGESWQDRIDLAFALRDLGVDSVPINFLYAHPGTPLKDTPPLSADEALRIIALYRFLLPTVTLRICGGRTHVLGDRQADLFAAGANGMMTGNYLTVAGSQHTADRAMIHALGLEISTP